MINSELWTKAETIVSSLVLNDLYDQNGALNIRVDESGTHTAVATYEYEGNRYYFYQVIPFELLNQVREADRPDLLSQAENRIIRGITKNIYNLLETSLKNLTKWKCRKCNQFGLTAIVDSNDPNIAFEPVTRDHNAKSPNCMALTLTIETPTTLAESLATSPEIFY